MSHGKFLIGNKIKYQMDNSNLEIKLNLNGQFLLGNHIKCQVGILTWKRFISSLDCSDDDIPISSLVGLES
jgi:hypothetical protein